MKYSFWRRLIEVIHGGRGRWLCLPVNKGVSGCWQTIVSAVNRVHIQNRSIHSCIKAAIGNGKVVRFWLDHWYGDSLLKDRWPNLFKLEGVKNCCISDRIVQDSAEGKGVFADRWRRGLFTVAEISEWQELNEIISRFTLSDKEDGWTWKVNEVEDFSVSNVKKWMREGRDIKRDQIMKWDRWIPSKVYLFIWRAEMKRLPTRDALSRRGIYVADPFCSLCADAAESVDHVFTGCRFSMGVWAGIGTWCKIGPIFAFDFSDLLTLINARPGGNVGKR